MSHVNRYLFCGVKESFNKKVQVCFLSMHRNEFYLMEFEDSEYGLREFQNAKEEIQNQTNSILTVFSLPVHTYFKSAEFKNYFLDGRLQILKFNNKLILNLFSLLDFEYEAQIKNSSVALACLGATVHFAQCFMKNTPHFRKFSDFRF